MRALLVCSLFVLATWPASARDSEALTVSGGILCLSPFKLTEARAAARNGDMNWVRELQCIVAKGNDRVVLVEPNAAEAHPWKVRLYVEGGESVTVYGWADAFKSKSGKPLWVPPN